MPAPALRIAVRPTRPLHLALALSSLRRQPEQKARTVVAEDEALLGRAPVRQGAEDGAQAIGIVDAHPGHQRRRFHRQTAIAGPQRIAQDDLVIVQFQARPFPGIGGTRRTPGNRPVRSRTSAPTTPSLSKAQCDIKASPSSSSLRGVGEISQHRHISLSTQALRPIVRPNLLLMIAAPQEALTTTPPFVADEGKVSKPFRGSTLRFHGSLMPGNIRSEATIPHPLS